MSHEDLCIFMKIDTHISCLPENCTAYEIMWKNVVEPDRPQMTIWRMRIACWITKAAETLSDCAMRIAFAQQILLRERASVLNIC